MTETSSPAGGVFLSYAREDTEAARRIADALRAFGMEVWFDQAELRGGDAWDAKIKRQIRECALFAPIVSANTQARGEGYFRREWKLAVERTHDMAAGVPFLLPIVIDDTLESEALVPEELMRVQWTRLPRGVPTPQFVELVKRLLDGPRKAAPDAGRPRAAAFPAPHTPPGGRRVPAWTWGALAALIAAIATGVFVSRKPVPAAPPAKPAVEAAAPTPAAPKAADKSVAVLPFTNMSEEKDNAFFTDGIHEDILTNLALIRELRVVSRTSVMQYRNTTKPIGQIAAELGVAYILEGSVQRSGNKVRVTGQLIRAATDEHVWAQAFDRDLTDIFTIQAELAQAIAGALKTALSPAEKVMIAQRPTENTVAYDLYLRARDTRNREPFSPPTSQELMTLLQKAVETDPEFAQAWGELADVYARCAFEQYDDMDSLVAKAKAAIDRAVLIAPDNFDVIRSLGTYYYYGYRDYARATEQYERLARQQPNDPTVFNSLGLIQRRQGHWPQALANQRRATELDSANISYLHNLESTLLAGNRFDEALSVQRRIVALLPDRIDEGYYLASIPFVATGSTREGDDYFAGLDPEKANSPAALHFRQDWAETRGDYAEAIRLDRIQPYYEGSPMRRWEQAVAAAGMYYFKGDRPGAEARLGNFPDELRQRLSKEPKNARNWAILGLAEVILGHRAEALRCADRSVALMPESLDALDGPVYAVLRAQTYDYAGEKERALAEYTRLLRVPGNLNLHALKAGFSTLQGDPRFEALVNNPANNAPLF